MQATQPNPAAQLPSRFRIRTLDEASALAHALSVHFPSPETARYGIAEMLINAIEHGNLGISYEEKKRLMLEGCWHEEVTRRLALPEYAGRYVELHCHMTEDQIVLSIHDQGNGFDPSPYFEMTPERANDPNGRGIATACGLSFDTVEYVGCGNHVICIVYRETAESERA